MQLEPSNERSLERHSPQEETLDAISFSPNRSGSSYSEEKLGRIRSALGKRGFDSLPHFTVTPDAPGAEPVVLITGGAITTVKPGKHIDTPTKYYYEPTGNEHLVNTSAAVALSLADRNIRSILQVKQEQLEETRRLLDLHPRGDKITLVSGDMASLDFISSVYEAASKLSGSLPISRMDIVLYESYAAGLEKPFIPMFEDSPDFAGEVTSRRIAAFHNMFMAGYDLLVARDQTELRIIGLTALASKRASANLSTDTLHKVASSALLETFAYEASYYAEKPVYVVEIAPGMVDSGPYDSSDVRQAVYEEAEMDGFPFSEGVTPGDPQSWPLMSVKALGEISAAYLLSKEGEKLDDKVVADNRHLTSAGRTSEEFKAELLQSISESDDGELTLARGLPSFAFAPGVTWNGFSPLRRGYLPIMLTPRGQYF